MRSMGATPIPSLRFEKEAWNAGATWVAGVDEVGVGPLAGPVAAGVVALPAGRRFRWYARVRDSKVLPNGPGMSSPRRSGSRAVRDRLGLGGGDRPDRDPAVAAALHLRAFEALGVKPDAVISDALDLPLPNVRPVIDGDALSVAVAAASIVAKVARDALMQELCGQYPGYNLCRNKGYPTPEHKRLLQERGPSPIHRRSYAPVAQFAFRW